MNRKIALLVTALTISLLAHNLPTNYVFSTTPITAMPFENASPSAKYENATVHEGDLIIDGYKTAVIENCTFIQTGNIYVRDFGKLIVRNAVLQINQTSLWQYEIIVQDYGTLELENVSVATKFGLNVYFRHHAQIYIINSSIEFNPLTYMHFTDSSKTNITLSNLPAGLDFSQYSHLSIVNSSISDLFWSASSNCVATVSYSTIGRLSVGGFGYGMFIEIRDLKSSFYEYLNLLEKLSPVRSSLTLIGVFVKAWWVSFGYDANVRILESSIILGISYYHASAHISSLTPTYYNFVRIGKIYVINTTVLQFMIGAINSKLTIENSVMHFLPGGSSQVTFTNSSIDFHIGDFFGSLYFRKTNKWRGGILVHSSFFMSGNITFEEGPPFITWLKTNITRNSDTIVRDSYGNLIPNASLALYSKDNILMWNGTTNGEGKANFNITFNDANYEDFWTLTVNLGMWNASKQVGFFTDTPLEITLDNMPPFVEVIEPVNGSMVYGTIQIKTRASDNVQLERITLYVDEALVENASLRWKSYTYTAALNTRTLANGTHNITAIVYDTSGNVNASSILVNVQNLLGDLNGDGKVNIIDISIIARAFTSKPGDVRWNPEADVDKNGAINIVDVAMVARNFGKATARP